MENLIRKEEKKGKTTQMESSDNDLDPFEEYNQYIKQPQLR